MSRDNYKHDNNRCECQSNQFFFLFQVFQKLLLPSERVPRKCLISYSLCVYWQVLLLIMVMEDLLTWILKRYWNIFLWIYKNRSYLIQIPCYKKTRVALNRFFIYFLVFFFRQCQTEFIKCGGEAYSRCNLYLRACVSINQ